MRQLFDRFFGVKGLWPLVLILVVFNVPPLFLRESADGCIQSLIGLSIGLFGLAVLFIKGENVASVGLLSMLWILFWLATLPMLFSGKIFDSSLLIMVLLLGYCKLQNPEKLRDAFFILTELALVLGYIVIALQYFKVLPSMHGKVAFTGFFLNPNQLAIYLGTLVSILAANSYHRHKHQPSRHRWQLILMLIGLGILLVLRCRAAYLGLLVSGVFLFRRELYLVPRRYWLLSAAALAVLAVWMYRLKSLSADGRLYLWKLGWGLLEDNLAFGVGAGNFQVSLMERQSHFFQNGANVLSFRKFAGQYDYAFFDLLQFFVERGMLVGLVLVALIAYLIYRVTGWIKADRGNSLLIPCFTGLLFLGVCSLVNYAFYVPQLKLLAMLLIAIVLTCERERFTLKSAVVKSIVGCCSIIVLAQAGAQFYGIYGYHSLKKKAVRFDDSGAFTSLQGLYPLLKANPRYLVDLAVLNKKFHPGDIARSISLLEESRRVYLHRTNTLILAGYYLRQGEREKAEGLYLYECYTKAWSGESYYTLLDFYFKSVQRQKFNAFYARVGSLQVPLGSWQSEQLALMQAQINAIK